MTIARGSVPKLVIILLTVLIASSAPADIYQWEWVNPNDHSQGKQQSSILCPDGAGIVAGPGSLLDGRNLTQAYLFQSNLNNASWFSCTLNDAYFGQANLYQMLLYGSALQNADFTHVDAHTTNFRFDDLSGADFTDANLQSAKLNFSTLDNANLTRADLSNASLGFSTFYNANFTNALIAGVQFNGATQNGFTQQQLHATASFKNHNLRGLGFGQTDDLSGWDFSGGIDLTQSNFTLVTLNAARFNAATLTNSSFLNARLASADFSGAAMSGCWLEASDLSHANFSGANMTSAEARSSNWTGANLTDATISGAIMSFAKGLTAQQIYSTSSYKNGDLHGVDLSFNDLNRWSFNGVNVTDANFVTNSMRSVDFRNANLTRTILVGANLQDIDFSGATLAQTDLTDSDLRGCRGLIFDNVISDNDIYPDGGVNGLGQDTFLGGLLDVHNYLSSPAIGVTIHRSVNHPHGISFLFDDGLWQSTVGFDAGIPVNFDGTRLVLTFDAGVDPVALLGRSFKIFDWTGVSRIGNFDVYDDGQNVWDTSQLYSQGLVTLVAIPEPRGIVFALVAVACVSGVRHAQREGRRAVLV